MSKVIIAADSTCDLSQKLIDNYKIHVIPLPVNLGDKACLDGVDVHTNDLFEYYKNTGKLATTSAPTPSYFEDYYTKWLNEGYEVVHFSISSEMTSTPNIAKMASKNYENVHTIDSRNVSAGMGVLAILACEMRDLGLNSQEIEDKINILRPNIKTSFVINTLEYLYKGGRCTGVAALGANLLKLKPCIEVRNGKMVVGKKYRGNISDVIFKYIKDKFEDTDETIDRHHLIIVKNDIDDEIIEQALKQIRQYKCFDSIEVTDTGCSVAVHCGPGTFGLIYEVKNNLV